MKLTFFVFLFTISSFISAQKSFEMGAMFGTELSFPVSRDSYTAKSVEALPGFNLGIRFRHNFSERFSLVGGLEYGRMYFHPITPYINTPAQYAYAQSLRSIANQIRIPILFQLNLGSKKSRFFINSGACILASFANYESWSSTTWGQYPREYFSDYDIGGMVGAGYSYSPVSFIKLFSEVKFMVPFIGRPVNVAYMFCGNCPPPVAYSVRTLTLSWQVGITFVMKPVKF